MRTCRKKKNSSILLRERTLSPAAYWFLRTRKGPSSFRNNHVKNKYFPEAALGKENKFPEYSKNNGKKI
jgi:hypothetical protein